MRRGWAALIAPSAARPELDQILCVFCLETRILGVTPLPPPRRLERPPPVPPGLAI